MPMDKRRYGENWRKVSRTIRRIAGNRCESCGIRNGDLTARSKRLGLTRKVVLTVAHIGAPRPTGESWTVGDPHDKHDVRRENLRAWCQACHFSYDREDHIQHSADTRAHKKRQHALASGQLDLFAEEVA